MVRGSALGSDRRVRNPGPFWNNIVYGPVQDFLCVDLFHDIYVPGVYQETPEPPDPLQHQDRAAWLYENVFFQLSSDPVVARLQGAAVQLAIWDIIHDNGDGFSSGRIEAAPTTDPTVLAYANQYEALSLGKSAMDMEIYYAVGLNPQNGQIWQPLLGTPEPAPTWITLAGLAVVAALGYRRRSRVSL